MSADLRLGRWQDVLADVACDSLICDPPYLSASANAGGSPFGSTEKGNKKVASGPVMPYQPASTDMLIELCQWSKRCRGWCVFFNDFDGAHLIRSTLLSMGAVVAEPIAWAKPDGLCAPRGALILPKKGTEFIVCARHVQLTTWHTHLPGSYSGPATMRPMDLGITGAKPLDLMRAIVRDYSKPGDLVCDPFSGSGTTGLACLMEGRRFVGAEEKPEHYEMSKRRMAHYQPGLL